MRPREKGEPACPKRFWDGAGACVQARGHYDPCCVALVVATTVRFFEARPSCPQNIGPGGPPSPHRTFQGRVFPAGSDDGYRRTGHRDAVIELPGPDGSHYYLTRQYVLSLFDQVGG